MMMNFRFNIIVLFLLSTRVLFSQDPKLYNEIYVKTYIETSQIDFDKAVATADSLLKISETPLFKTKSLMLLASLYQQKGDFKKSIDYALQSEKIIQKTDIYIWRSRVHGFLSTQYRILKLNNESKKYLDKGFEDLKHIDDSAQINSTKGFFYQEMAYIELDLKNYQKAISYLELSDESFKSLQKDANYLNAANLQLFGAAYLGLNQVDKAKEFLDKALVNLEDEHEGYSKALVFINLSKVSISKNELTEAHNFLKMAEPIVESSPYLELKNVFYETYRDYYFAINDTQNLKEINKKIETTNEEISTLKSSFIDETITTLSSNKEKLQKSSKDKNRILLVVGILTVLGCAYFLWYRKKKKEEIQRFEEILRKLEEKKKNTELFLDEAEIGLNTNENQSLKKAFNDVPTTDPKNATTEFMPKETEQKILMKLKEFEASNKFNDNKISLSALSVYCETNNKYMSYVIGKYKKMDFNNYINHLRIEFIIEKLQTNSKYRKYKIAVLAEEAGFSSPNKFSTVFKSVTSISPSTFIKLLDS